MEATVKSHHSKSWKDICSSRELIKDNSSYVIGSGKDVNIFEDKWLHSGPVVSDFGIGDLQGFSMDLLMDKEIRKWDSSCILDICVEEWVEQIQKINILEDPFPDQLMWTAEPSGFFSVKSALRKIQGFREEPANPVWGSIWKLHVHERGRVFFWRMASGC